MSIENQKPRVFHHHCLFCGGILTSPKSIKRGYGPSCWKKVQPKPIKPYVQETPFVDDGSTEHLSRNYGELYEGTGWWDSY